MLTVLTLGAVAGVLLAPLVGQLIKATDTQAAAVRRASRARRLNPRQASAVEAAVARVVTAGPEYEGHTLQLPCAECGRRAVPPVAHVDSPPIPWERAGLLPMGHLGFVITATCTACDGPLISRVFDEEYAEHARTLGVIDGEPLEVSLAGWLDTL